MISLNSCYVQLLSRDDALAIYSLYIPCWCFSDSTNQVLKYVTHYIINFKS